MATNQRRSPVCASSSARGLAEETGTVGGGSVRSLFFGVLLVFLAVAGGHLYTADDWSRFHAARSLLVHGSPTLPNLPHVYGVEGSGGKTVSHFPPGLSLACLPFLAAGHVLGRMIPAHAESLERAACSVLNQVVVAWLVTLLFRLMLRAGGRFRDARGLALGAAFGSLAFPYAKHFWAEPLQTALLVGALLQVGRLWDGERTPHRYAVLSAALAGAVLVKYESLVPAAVIVGATVATAPPPRRAWPLVGAPWILLALLLASYNLWRFGSLVRSGYGGLVLGPPSEAGEASVLAKAARRVFLLLLSPGQGLFVFVPAAMVAAAGTLLWCRASLACLGSAAGWASFLLLVMLDRSSTWCWGPRYLFPSMVLWWPALLWVPRRGRTLVWALLGMGVIVAVLGVLVNFHDAIEEIRTSAGLSGWEWVGYVQRELRASPILWHAKLLAPYLRRTVADGLGTAPRSTEPVAWRHRHVDIVWLSLWAGGASPLVLGVPVVLLAGGASFLRRFQRGES